MAKDKEKQKQELKVKNKKIPLDEGRTLEELKNMIRNDIEETETYLEENYIPKWDKMQNAYQGIRVKGANVPEWRANMSINLAFGTVNQEKANALNIMYDRDGLFTLVPRDLKGENGKDLDMSARAREKVMQIQETEMKMYRELHDIIMDSLIYSIGWSKFTWDFKIKKRKYLDISDTGELVEVSENEEISKPKLESVEPWNIIADRYGKDVDSCRFVAHRFKLYYKDVIDNPLYNMTEEVSDFLSSIKDNKDLMQQGFCTAYEYWTDEEVIVYTETGHILRKHASPLKHGRKPFLRMVKYPIQRKLYGLSTMEMVFDLQQFTNSVYNATVDNLNLSMNKMFTIKSNSESVPKQIKARPGLVIRTREDNEFKELPISPLSNDIWRTIQQNDIFINQTVSNEDTVDSSGGADTATEARISNNRANQQRVAYIDYNRECFFKPYISMWLDMNEQFLKPKEMVKLIGEREADKLGIEEKKIDEKAKYTFVITGENPMDDKQTAIENLNILMDMVAKVPQLPPQINQDLLIKTLVNKFDAPEGLYIEPEERPEEAPQESTPQGQGGIAQEIGQAAAKLNMDPEQMLTAIAQKLGTSPDGVLQMIEQAGSFAAFIQQNQAALQGGAPQNPAAPQAPPTQM